MHRSEFIYKFLGLPLCNNLNRIFNSKMKKNDPERSRKYHSFLARQEKEKKEKMKGKKEKRELKEAMAGICSKLQLEDNIEIDMDGPKKIITRRAHAVAMKKKVRKQKKEPEPEDSMDLI